MPGLIDMTDRDARRRAAGTDFFSGITRGDAPPRTVRREAPSAAIDEERSSERVSAMGRRSAAPAWDVHMAGGAGAASRPRRGDDRLPPDDDEEQSAEMFEHTATTAAHAEEEDERRRFTAPPGTRLTGPQARFYNSRVRRLDRATMNAREFGDDEVTQEEEERVYVRGGKVQHRVSRRVDDIDLDGSVDASRVRRRAGHHLPGVHHFEDEEMAMQREAEERSSALRARMLAAHGDAARRLHIT